MQQFRFDQGRVALTEAWTTAEIRDAVGVLFDAFADRLPVRLDARIVLKPDVSDDLVALAGGGTDLRVLSAVVRAFEDRGYTDLSIADGSRVGLNRRGVSVVKRLRVDRLAAHLGVRLVDLDIDAAHQVVLFAGAHPRIAATVLECDFLVSIPTIRTHPETGLSCAMQNWVGIARGQDRRQLHHDLGRNIFAINEVVLPDLVLVDGVVGMSGSVPRHGHPLRLGRLLLGDSAFLIDLVVSRLVGLPVQAVPSLGHARDAGHLDDAVIDAVWRDVPELCAIEPARPRSRRARIAASRKLSGLREALRPLTDRPAFLETAYRLGIIDEVQCGADDGVSAVHRASHRCGDCEKCVGFCPTGLTLDEIGTVSDPDRCITCLYCWWVCPNEAISLDGPLHAMQRQVGRFKKAVEAL